MNRISFILVCLLLLSCNGQLSCNKKKVTRKVDVESHSGKAYFVLVFDQKDINPVNFEVGNLIADDYALNDEYTFRETSEGRVLEQGDFSEGLKDGTWHYTYEINNKKYPMQVEWDVFDEVPELEISLPDNWQVRANPDHFFNAGPRQGDGITNDSSSFTIEVFPKSYYPSLDSCFSYTRSLLGKSEGYESSNHFLFDQDSIPSYYSYYAFGPSSKRMNKFMFITFIYDTYYCMTYASYKRNRIEEQIKFFEIIRNTRIKGNKPLNYICSSLSAEVLL